MKLKLSLLLLFWHAYFSCVYGQGTHMQLDSLCAHYSPCDSLKIVRDGDIPEIFASLYDSLSGIDRKRPRYVADSILKNASQADLTNQLFLDRLKCYHCLVDIFYLIYEARFEEQWNKAFGSLRDTVFVDVRNNDNPMHINSKYVKIFCLYYSLKDSSSSCCRVETLGHAKNGYDFSYCVKNETFNYGFIHPGIQDSCYSYFVVKYKCRYYLLSYQFPGDVIHLDFSKMNHKHMVLKLERTFLPTVFLDSYQNIRQYSNRNRQIVKDAKRGKLKPETWNLQCPPVRDLYWHKWNLNQQ